MDCVLKTQTCQLCWESLVETWVHCHNISRSLQWRLSVPYRLAPRADARQARSLIRPWLQTGVLQIFIFQTSFGPLHYVCSNLLNFMIISVVNLV